MNTLYLITARGGSKGIPGKNIKPLAGKPLIAYTIECALAAGADPNDICVSTDSADIADISEKWGIKVPFMRPDELASDSAGSYQVILHALDFFEGKGKHYDRVVLLQPTSPFRTPDDIKGAVALWKPETDMVVSVTEASANPYYDAFEADSDGYLHISKGSGNYTRRQDAPKVWQYNGAVYVISTDSLRKGPFKTFSRVVPFLMPRERSVDLDTPVDWMLAEFMIEATKKSDSSKTDHNG